MCVIVYLVNVLMSKKYFVCLSLLLISSTPHLRTGPTFSGQITVKDKAQKWVHTTHLIFPEAFGTFREITYFGGTRAHS